MLTISTRKQLRDLMLSIDLSFGQGVTAIVGPSGAGKSTLLRLIAGLDRLTEGTISLNGVMLDEPARRVFVPPQHRDIGVVFQDYALFPHLSVAENIAYGLRARSMGRQQRNRSVADYLARFGLQGLADQRPTRISGGQRQRVALARAMIMEPQALLLDEPLGALDAQTRSEVRHELREILERLEVPTLLVTHDYADALAFRQRIVILVDGQVVQDGPHDELLTHPASRFVAAFTGMNYLSGQLVSSGGNESDSTMARIILDGGVVLYTVADGIPDGRVNVVVHPWEITLSTLPPQSSARNVLPGRVREILPLGGRVRVTVKLEPGTHAGDHSVKVVDDTTISGAPVVVAEVTPEALHGLAVTEGTRLYAAFKATALVIQPE